MFLQIICSDSSPNAFELFVLSFFCRGWRLTSSFVDTNGFLYHDFLRFFTNLWESILASYHHWLQVQLQVVYWWDGELYCSFVIVSHRFQSLHVSHYFFKTFLRNTTGSCINSCRYVTISLAFAIYIFCTEHFLFPGSTLLWTTFLQ